MLSPVLQPQKPRTPDNDAACLADLLKRYFFLSCLLSFSAATRPTVDEADISFSEILLVSRKLTFLRYHENLRSPVLTRIVNRQNSENCEIILVH